MKYFYPSFLLFLLYGSVTAAYTDKDHGTAFGFTENKGQVADELGNPRPDILFTTIAEGMKIYIGAKGIYYQFSQVENPEMLNRRGKGHAPFATGDGDSAQHIIMNTYRLDVELLGANPSPTVLKEKATGYYENYYLPHCPNGIIGARSYEKITLQEVYPGIDWVFYRKGHFMKYDFIVRPGADPAQIKLQF